MQQVPHTDSSEFADLMDFIATSGRVRSHPYVNENADKLVSQMWSGRAKAMTQSLAAMAKAAVRGTT
jgi:hypothetical protein